MNSAQNYIPLLYHSNYGDGGSDFKTLFEHLNNYGFDACGIVDRTFFGLAEFIKYAKEYRIKPLIGGAVELNRSRIYLFVKNSNGYKNLCQILTLSAFNTLTTESLKNHAQGLILLSNSLQLLKTLAPAFTDIYYLLLPYHSIIDRTFPPIAANEIYYVTENDFLIYRLMSIIKNKTDRHNRNPTEHLLEKERFNRIFASYPHALKNNRLIRRLCNFIPQNHNWLFPEVVNGLDEILKSKTAKLTPDEKKRLEYELRIIKETGFEPYFSLTYYLKQFACAQNINMNVRGSAASSFTLYLLGLSVVNPLRYNLPFERFLNPQRQEPPDIDLDVEFNQRERLIKELFKKFGPEYIAHIAVINRFKTKASFRNTARACGISNLELKRIDHHRDERLIQMIAQIARKINGYPHYFSCHPSGIVITPKPIYEYVPLYPGPSGRTIQFDKDGIKLLGLVKIDILGVRGFPGIFLQKENIDFTDQQVYRFIGEGKTLGCFQLESPMVRQFLRKIQPKSLIDIANAIAIIRPGPARGGMKEKFLRRLNKEEKVVYPHPRLKTSLSDTLGIPIYQEQILQMAHNFANFSLSDADVLRRAITKERNSDLIRSLREVFFKKSIEMGYEKRVIEEVWARISSFSAFGFNKAHSITYATLGYLSAYQKFYDPVNFFCRVINNRGGYYPLYAYINEARRAGIKVLPPDINRSMEKFTVINSSLLVGLDEIKGLSLSTIEKIIKLRPFKDPLDFFYRVRPSITEGMALVKSRALDIFNEPWPKLYFLLLYSRLTNCRLGSRLNKNLVSEKFPDFKDLDSRIKVQEQLHTLGFLPEYHILEPLYPERTLKIAHLPENKKIEVIVTPIAQRTILTKNKRLMSFLTLDDETGVIEAILFPDKYRDQPTAPIVQLQGTLKDNSMIISRLTNVKIV